MEKISIIEYFYRLEKEKADQPFLHQPFGESWETYSYGEVGRMARKVATAINEMVEKPKSHIGLVSKNCREWIIADLAIMMAGHVSVPFFPTLTGEQINEVLDLGDVDLIFAGKTEMWDDMGKGIPEDLPMITFPHYAGNSKIERGRQWDDIMDECEPITSDYAPDMDDLYTIVFTSGTTGTPKGVMLKYATSYQLLFQTGEYNALELSRTGANRYFSYLPLNHIAERAIVENSCLTYGGEIFFTESLARFGDNLRHARPTVFFAVPRIWTKLMLGVLDKMPQKKLSRLLSIPFISGITKRKIATGIGLDKSRCNVSGAAPIPQSTKDWFEAVGVPIAEGYGMTEQTSACTFMKVKESRPGSVGKAQIGTEIRIDEETNEIITRSGYTMSGYYKSPEQTAKTLVDGWLHTGDQGRLDEDGYLYITGRVKDTFKTAKGKFIVPVIIEDKFSSNMDIEQLCLLGLGMPQPVLLVAPSEMGHAKSVEQLKESLNASLTEANIQLPSYQKIATCVVIKEPFSIESGTLTPTLKVKRSQLNTQYKDRLLDYCNTPDGVIWEQ